MQLQDLINPDDLRTEIAAGYVTERYHPEFHELAILNYTDQAQFDNHWNNVTKQTRGLIYNAQTGRIIARPFAKFYNYGDMTNTGDLDPDMSIMSAHNKWDGSLGIAYKKPDGKYAIATRGSFESEQAKHATALIEANPALLGYQVEEETDLFEIIYPDNRIVLDYGDRDELIWLGFVNIKSGNFYPYEAAEDLQASTLREVIDAPSRPNAEGWVVWLDRQRAIKFKQDDYLALHRVISSLTTKEIWRQLRAGTIDEFVTALPDEFHEWARVERSALASDFANVEQGVDEMERELKRENLPDRKSQALWINANAPVEYRGFLFARLDGKDITDSIWRLVEPKKQPVAA